MNGREYLGEIKRLDLYIKQRERELSELREAASCVSATDFKRIRVSPGSRKKYTAIDKFIDTESEIKMLINNMVEKKHKIIGEIQSLDNPLYAQVIFERYVEFKSLESIADEMNYNYGYIRRVHGEAVRVFERDILCGQAV